MSIEYYLRTVDWNWLTSHPDAKAREAAIWDHVEHPRGKIVSTTFLGTTGLYMCLAELLEMLASDDFNGSGHLIRVGLLPILRSDEPAMDELGLANVNLFLTMSPESVARAVEACASLDLEAIKVLQEANTSGRGLIGTCG